MGPAVADLHRGSKRELFQEIIDACQVFGNELWWKVVDVGHCWIHCHRVVRYERRLGLFRLNLADELQILFVSGVGYCDRVGSRNIVLCSVLKYSQQTEEQISDN